MEDPCNATALAPPNFGRTSLGCIDHDSCDQSVCRDPHCNHPSFLITRRISRNAFANVRARTRFGCLSFRRKKSSFATSQSNTNTINILNLAFVITWTIEVIFELIRIETSLKLEFVARRLQLASAEGTRSCSLAVVAAVRYFTATSRPRRGRVASVVV